MQTITAGARVDETDTGFTLPGRGAVAQTQGATSWGAIIAGAFVAVATSLILLSLGTGLEFAAVSPQPDQGIAATTFAVTTAIWLIVTQWISAALGGYITGRLRTRWIGTHRHEVFFRDTAHGFVMWSLATVVIAGVMANSVASALTGVARAADRTVVGATSAAAPSVTPYAVDKLFRASAATVPAAPDARDVRAEALHIVSNVLSTGVLPDPDRAYLASLIVQATGATPEDAQRRVDDLIRGLNDEKARLLQATDAARKSGAETAIYTALSMLIGAFIASVAAALAGHLRDEHV
jgi:hypothetical protein